MTRILFIGNSFTNRNDLPGTLTLLAASATPPRKIVTARVIANGMALKTHWTRGDAAQAIRKARWDYVVLQEQSTLPLKNRQRMHESIRLFDKEIRARGAKTVLYLTWARAGEPTRQDDLTDAYLSIGRELDAIVAPVGVAWQRLQRDGLPIALHDRDKSHPNPVGSYVAACVFFATIFRTSPVGLTAAVAGVEALDAGAVRQLQEAAWDAVQNPA
jgi:hypothetical protein